MKIFISLLGLCLLAASDARKSYDGYQVLSVVPTTIYSIEFLRGLMISDVQVDFWKEPSRLGVQVDIMVGPDHLADFQRILTEADIGYFVSIENVQTLVTTELEHLEGRNIPGQYVFNINDFNTIEDIYAWLQALQCPTGYTCELINIGSSYEGRPIYVLKISKSGTGRLAYWIDATIHAREWITTATILQIINNFVTLGDANAIDLLDRYDWYFLTVMNPDGYSYTWTDERLWRKNRRQNTDVGSLCYGTDLNRNFDFRWGHDGVSTNPCDETYCGPSGGSEPETQAVSNALVSLGPTIVAMVTLHSYGNLWMFPWGNTVNFNGVTCDLADDHAELMRVANAAADAVQNTYNTRWDRGNSCQVIYATTGGTDDFAKGGASIVYAYCPELRGNSFIISADQIPLSFNEIWNGIVAMVNAIGA